MESRAGWRRFARSSKRREQPLHPGTDGAGFGDRLGFTLRPISRGRFRALLGCAQRFCEAAGAMRLEAWPPGELPRDMAQPLQIRAFFRPADGPALVPTFGSRGGLYCG